MAAKVEKIAVQPHARNLKNFGPGFGRQARSLVDARLQRHVVGNRTFIARRELGQQLFALRRVARVSS